jgi:hypothetical protein
MLKIITVTDTHLVYICLILKGTIFHSIIAIKLSREWFIHQTVLELKPWKSDSVMDHASGTNSVVIEPKLKTLVKTQHQRGKLGSGMQMATLHKKKTPH